MKVNSFINIPFNESTLDLYYIRSSIFQALNKNLDQFNGRLLDIGCGKMPYKQFILDNSKVIEYVGLDIETALEYDSVVKPDSIWDGINMPFENDSFDSAFGTEVLEHCPEPAIVIKEVHRVLKTRACFFFTVPFLWPLHEVPNDEYRYTPFSLTRMLRENGFDNIEINATGGWHASLAQMLGLWIRRAPMTNRRRKHLAIILKPFIKGLLIWEKKTAVDFKEGQMITGLFGVAFKT